MTHELTEDGRMRGTDALARACGWLRRNGGKAVVELVVNFAAPFVIYGATRGALGDLYALMAASAPPLLWSSAELARRRRIDALSLIVLAGIGLSLTAMWGGGGVKFLQLREHLVAAVIGLAFLGSAAVGKPLIYQLAKARVRRRGGAEKQGFEALQDHPIFRRAMLVLTLAWGVALVAEALVAGFLVFFVSIRLYLLLSAIIGYGSLGALTAWTFWYARRRAMAARAAIAAAGSGR